MKFSYALDSSPTMLSSTVIFGTNWQYFLCLGSLAGPSLDYSGEVEGRWSVDRSAFNVRAMGVWVCLIWRATGSWKDLHIWDAVWRRKASRTFSCLKSDPKTEGRRKPMGEIPFVHECRTALCKPFTDSERIISGTSGRLRFGPS